jgi:hypothetical protein
MIIDRTKLDDRLGLVSWAHLSLLVNTPKTRDSAPKHPFFVHYPGSEEFVFNCLPFPCSFDRDRANNAPRSPLGQLHGYFIPFAQLTRESVHVPFIHYPGGDVEFVFFPLHTI